MHPNAPENQSPSSSTHRAPRATYLAGTCTTQPVRGLFFSRHPITKPQDQPAGVKPTSQTTTVSQLPLRRSTRREMTAPSLTRILPSRLVYIAYQIRQRWATEGSFEAVSPLKRRQQTRMKDPPSLKMGLRCGLHPTPNGWGGSGHVHCDQSTNQLAPRAIIFKTLYRSTPQFPRSPYYGT